MATTNHPFVEGITLDSFPCDTWDQARTGVVSGANHVTVSQVSDISMAAIEPTGMRAAGYGSDLQKYAVRQGWFKFGSVDLTGATALQLTFNGLISSLDVFLTPGVPRTISFDVMYGIYVNPGSGQDFKSYNEILPITTIDVPWSSTLHNSLQQFTWTLPLPLVLGVGEFGIFITPSIQRSNVNTHSDWFVIFGTTLSLTVTVSDVIRPPRPHVDPLIEFWTDVAANKILSMAFCDGGDEVVLPDKLYLALYSTNCTRTTPGTELTGNGYARIEVPTMIPTQYADALDYWEVTNDADIEFSAATTDWPLVVGWAMWSDITGGEYLCFGRFPGNAPVPIGNKLTFPIASIMLRFGFFTGTSPIAHPATEQVMKAFFIQDVDKDPLTYFPTADETTREFALQFYTTGKPSVTTELDIDNTTPRKITFGVPSDGKIFNTNEINYATIPTTNVGKVISCAALIVDGLPWPINDGNLATSGFSKKLEAVTYSIRVGALSVEIY